jgi:hypothetical protein
MPKKIHKIIAALFIVSTLNACAGLPLIGTRKLIRAGESGGYCRSRHRTSITGKLVIPPNIAAAPPAFAGPRKPITPSRDVVFSGQAKAEAARSRLGQETGPRISLIIPVQSGVAAPGADRRQSQGQGTSRMVANPNPAATPKVQRNPCRLQPEGQTQAERGCRQ